MCPKIIHSKKTLIAFLSKNPNVICTDTVVKAVNSKNLKQNLLICYQMQPVTTL